MFQKLKIYPNGYPETDEAHTIKITDNLFH